MKGINNLAVLRILGVIAIIALSFVFFKILVYLIISTVLFLIGYPLTRQIERIKFGKYRVPDSISSLLTILVILSVVSLLFWVIIPPLVIEAQFLSALNFFDVLHNILDQFPLIKNALLKLGTEEDLHHNISSHLNEYINTSNISGALNHLFDYFGTVVGGTLCVLFITFFFLKDEQLVKQSILILTPSGKEHEMKDILATSKKMLSKYFAGLFLDMIIVGILVMTVLSILGIKNALIISFVAALLNVVPYIGSVLTMMVAVFLGVSGCIHSGNYEQIGPVINKIFFGLLSINLLDAFLLQPFIFSSSVKAHPLEVFLVTLMAAVIGGIPAMIVALPVYTLLRIIAKEFLTNLKFFRKISEKIDID